MTKAGPFVPWAGGLRPSEAVWLAQEATAMTMGPSFGVICLAALPASLGQGQLLPLSLHHSSYSPDLPSWSLKE